MNLLLQNANIQDILQNLSPESAVLHLSNIIEDSIVFSTSFSLEDQVLTHMLRKHFDIVKIFTLDTGRLFNETYRVWQETEEHFNIKIKAYYPDSGELEAMIHQQGINGFYQSERFRHNCCQIRKINPLNRALSGAGIWITGLRKEQSAFRDSLELLEKDRSTGILKYNPLIHWSFEDVFQYIKAHEIPYNELYDRGFSSIGCAPCTRAVLPGEDVRAGRWWWEESKKECGLHYNPSNKAQKLIP